MSSTTTTRRPRGCGKSRAVESEENQKQVFLPSHRPWKSRTTRAIPTFPTAPTAAGIYQTTSGNLIVVDRKECLTPDKPQTRVLDSQVLTGSDLKAVNGFDAPERVKPKSFDKPSTENGRTRFEVPPRSYTVIQWAA